MKILSTFRGLAYGRRCYDSHKNTTRRRKNSRYYSFNAVVASLAFQDFFSDHFSSSTMGQNNAKSSVQVMNSRTLEEFHQRRDLLNKFYQEVHEGISLKVLRKFFCLKIKY